MEGDETRRGKEALIGGHLCHVCGYQYPNPNPSAKLRRSHRRNCRKVAPATAGEDGGGGALGVHEREEAAGERNAGEGLVLGGGGEWDGGNGATEANGGSTLLGSAEEGRDSVGGKENADLASPNGAGIQVFTGGCVETGLNNCTNSSVETANEGNGINLPRACTNVSQHKVAKHCSENAPLAVAHPAEREDSFDEYLDASPFLHQSDPEDGAAVANKSDIPTEIQNLNEVSLGTNEVATEVSVEINGLCKDDFSRERSVADYSASFKAGKEVECYLENQTAGLVGPQDSLKLESTGECSVNIDSNNAERSSCDLFVEDTSHVQLPVENSCLANSLCSVLGYQNDLAVTNADGMLKSIADDNISEGILVKGGELDSSCEGRPQDVEQIVAIAEEDPSLEKHSGFSKEGVCNNENDRDVPTKYQVSTSREHVTLLMDQASCFKNPFNLDDTRSDDLFELASGSYHLVANVVESKQQVDSTSLTVSNQTSCTEGQHCLISDDRMLAVSSEKNAYDSENVSVSSSTDPTKNVPLRDFSVNHSVQEGEPHTSGIISQGTYAEEKIETEDTSTRDMTLVESIDNFEEKKQTGDTTAKEMNADNVEEKLSEDTGAGVNVDNIEEKLTEDTGAGVNVESIDNFEEKKQTGDTTAKEMNADNVEEKLSEDTGAGVNVDNIEEKLTEDTGAGVNVDNVEEKLTDDTGAGMNVVQHADAVEEEKQTEYTGAKGVRAERSMGSIHDNNETEDTSAKKTDTEFNPGNVEDKRQADDTSKGEMDAVQHTDNVEETNQAQETNATEMNAIQGTDNVEQKLTESTVGLQGNKPNEEIAAVGARLTSGRIHVPLKVLLAEASAENKEKKPSTKERVLSFRRRVSKDDAKPGPPKSGSDDLYWNSPAKLPHNNVDKRSKVRKQPWMPFICCHSVH